MADGRGGQRGDGGDGRGARAPERRLVRSVFDTAAFAPRERLDAWRELLNTGHHIDADPVGFSGRLSAVVLDRMVIGRMDASPLAVSRSPQQIRRDGLERFVLHLTQTGYDVDVHGASRRFAAGAVTVNDTTQPFRRSTASERGSVVVGLARDLVEDAIGEPERLHGQPLPPAANALLADHLRAVARWAGSEEAEPSADLARATAHLLAACVRPDAETVERARPAIEAAIRRRARRCIDAALASPDLTPDTLAATLGVSRSKLFALFEPYGGVASYIQRRRLAAARRRLSAPDGALRVADVAYACGFANASHFSRAFRRAFGISPSEFQADPAAAAPPPPASGGAAWDFARWLRALG